MLKSKWLPSFVKIMKGIHDDFRTEIPFILHRDCQQCIADWRCRIADFTLSTFAAGPPACWPNTACVYYDMAVDAKVLSTSELVVQDSLTVLLPNLANPTQTGSHQADDYYWQCSQLATRVEACELSFMRVDKKNANPWGISVEQSK